MNNHQAKSQMNLELVLWLCCERQDEIANKHAQISCMYDLDHYKISVSPFSYLQMQDLSPWA